MMNSPMIVFQRLSFLDMTTSFGDEEEQAGKEVVFRDLEVRQRVEEEKEKGLR